MIQTSCAEQPGDGRCPYCGSMSTARAIRLLETPGTRYSGSDWKYGYPHKFYIGNGKFYARHLALTGPEEVRRFSILSRDLLGVVYGIDMRGVWYKAPGGGMYGWQTWGIVGATRPTPEQLEELKAKLEAAVDGCDKDIAGAALKAHSDASSRFGPPIPQWVLDIQVV